MAYNAPRPAGGSALGASPGRRVDWRVVIRSLTPDEVVWFMGQELRYLGHSDPHGLSRRLGPRLRDARVDSARCYVYAAAGAWPTAGVHVRAPAPEDDEQTLHVDSLWHDGDPDGLRALSSELLRRFPHEAALAPLHAHPRARVAELADILGPLGFELDETRRLRFELADVPPLGSPLVLEAWTLDGDPAFRDLFERAEGRSVSDHYWAYLKRRHGMFFPDLWFMARETLDQEAVGYALCGTERRGVEATYALNGVGVLQEHRGSSEMLRRLVVTTLNELAASSPLGSVDTELSAADPKLIAILESLGFTTVERFPMLLRVPR